MFIDPGKLVILNQWSQILGVEFNDKYELVRVVFTQRLHKFKIVLMGYVLHYCV